MGYGIATVTTSRRGGAMEVETIRFVVDEEVDADYHRLAWALVDILAVIGARDQGGAGAARPVQRGAAELGSPAQVPGQFCGA